MKKRIIISIFFIVIMIFISRNKVQAKSYSIEDMDIKATINQDGSVSIEQEIEYEFKGTYNGVFLNIPYNLEDNEKKEIGNKNVLKESLYNGSNVDVNKVYIINNGTKIEYGKVQKAINGQNGVYTIINNKGIQQIKVYSPSTNVTKRFKIDYTIKDLCVKHNDIGELYYNFIGGEWEEKIKKLNIDIYIPQNQNKIEVWGHGPYNGQSKIVSNKHSNFKVENIMPGQYVAARVIFDSNNILNSQKLSNIDAKQLIYQEEDSIIENKKAKNAYTGKIGIVAICLFIYWIILIGIYEKDKKYKVVNIDEDELFKKYNPMVAGCIQGSRNILARDIIAIILGLINKKIIKLDIESKLEGKDDYSYFIAKNIELENEMDDIEKYVYDWVFRGNEIVDLTKRLQEMPKETYANQSFRKLSELVESELAQKGANQSKVPLLIRGFNIFLLALSIVLVIKHIMFNGFNMYGQPIHSLGSAIFIGALSQFSIILIMLFMIILNWAMNLIVIIRHKINKTVQRITGQKIVTTTISLLVLFGSMIILTAIFSPVKYIVVDEILICIATILVLTDNLMLKNSVIMIEDFSKLNALKDKIEDYSIMKDRDVEQVILWEQYLSYAVSFGVAEKIMKRIKGLYIDDDLTSLINNNLFYNFVTSDYYMFYNLASLDRRFLKSYNTATRKMFSNMASDGGFSRGSGGGFSGGGGYSGGGGRGRRRWSFLSMI